jgi:hypothetical protein
MKIFGLNFLTISSLVFLLSMPSALAQQNMERLLNNVDTPSSWANTPVTKVLANMVRAAWYIEWKQQYSSKIYCVSG